MEVVLLLLRIKHRIPASQFKFLKSFVSSTIDTESETGWEEATLASIEYLLSTCAADGKTQVQQTTQMKELTDTNRLKQCFMRLDENLQNIALNEDDIHVQSLE